jgi:IS5 family transposase
MVILAGALEQVAILSDVSPEVAIVDRGYKGVAIAGVKIYHPGLRRGITRGLRAMIRRRSAIEPPIGHMKTDGKLDRNWLKGAMGDAIHAVLCGGPQPADDPQEAAVFLRPYSDPAAELGRSRETLAIRPPVEKTNCSGPTR